MIEVGRCASCSHWNPVPPTGKRARPMGHCRLDQQLCHAAYSCARYRIPPLVLARSLGLLEPEIDWLKERPDSRITALFRIEYRLVLDSGETKDFSRRLEQWRAWRRVHGWHDLDLNKALSGIA